MGVICNDKRECFGRMRGGVCVILRETYPKGVRCPFCKPDRNITKGVRYKNWEEPKKKCPKGSADTVSG